MTVVLHISSVHPADDVRIYAKQCMSLQQYGYTVHLVARPPLHSTTGSVQVHALAGATGSRLGRIWSGYRGIWRMVQRLRPRIIHFHDPELLLLALVFRRMGYLVVYDVHEDLPRQILRKHWIPAWLRPLVSVVIEWIELRLAGRMSAVVAATPQIAQRFGRGQCSVVRNLPLQRELTAWSMAPSVRDKKALVYVGGLSVARGLLTMLDALQDLNRDGNCYVLHLAGKFDSPDDQSIFAHHPARGHVDFRGWLDRESVGQLLNQAGIALILLQPHQSYAESLPIKLFEYLGMGLPVLASDFPVWRAVFGEQQGVWWVNPQDKQAVVDRIRAINLAYEAATQASEQAQKRIQSTLTWEAECSQLLQLYAGLEHGAYSQSAATIKANGKSDVQK